MNSELKRLVSAQIHRSALLPAALAKVAAAFCSIRAEPVPIGVRYSPRFVAPSG
jgi:hypothetical protein